MNLLNKKILREETASTIKLEDIYIKNKLKNRDMCVVIQTYEVRMLNYATRFVCDRSSAEDVVQDAFIKLFNSWHKIKNRKDAVKCWLYRVVHNLAIDLIRKEQRYKEALSEHAKDLKQQKNCLETYTKKEKKELVLLNIDKLAVSEKEVLLLRLEEELSYKEIASITNRAIGNVGKILHRAVNKISQHLKEQGIIK